MDKNSLTRNDQTENPHPETWHRRRGEDVLVALAVNPHTVHVYWDLDPLKQHLLEGHLSRPWSDIPKVLRVCDVTWITFDGRNAHSIRDIHLDDIADNWYVTNLADGRDYVCLYGVITNSEFFALLRSDAVHTPRDSARSEGPRYAGPQVTFQSAPVKLTTQLLSRPTTLPAIRLVPTAAAMPVVPVPTGTPNWRTPDWQSEFTGYSLQPNPKPTPEQPAEEQPACL